MHCITMHLIIIEQEKKSYTHFKLMAINTKDLSTNVLPEYMCVQLD